MTLIQVPERTLGNKIARAKYQIGMMENAIKDLDAKAQAFEGSGDSRLQRVASNYRLEADLCRQSITLERRVLSRLRAASAIEARRAETVKHGSVHESAVPQGDAQTHPVANSPNSR